MIYIINEATATVDLHLQTAQNPLILVYRQHRWEYCDDAAIKV